VFSLCNISHNARLHRCSSGHCCHCLTPLPVPPWYPSLNLLHKTIVFDDQRTTPAFTCNLYAATTWYSCSANSWRDRFWTSLRIFESVNVVLRLYISYPNFSDGRTRCRRGWSARDETTWCWSLTATCRVDLLATEVYNISLHCSEFQLWSVDLDCLLAIQLSSLLSATKNMRYQVLNALLAFVESVHTLTIPHLIRSNSLDYSAAGVERNIVGATRCGYTVLTSLDLVLLWR
jgi:hypothetical protein